MPDFKFKTPIQVRYADLDAQWHVNNSRFLTFMEQARLEIYYTWDCLTGRLYGSAHDHCGCALSVSKAPILLGEKISVSTRTQKIGTKSITFDYVIEDAETQQVCGTGEVVGCAMQLPGECGSASLAEEDSGLKGRF
jgi:acyl-CoA thioester hydrolase